MVQSKASPPCRWIAPFTRQLGAFLASERDTMLKTVLIHPDILATLGRLGHGSKILIADGNFSFLTRTPASAVKVYLNLTPGIVSALQVLDALSQSIPIEAALAMEAPDNINQALLSEFAKYLPGIEIQKMKRIEFYDQVKSELTGLIIATGEQARFANLLLTIGVVKNPQDVP